MKKLLDVTDDPETISAYLSSKDESLELEEDKELQESWLLLTKVIYDNNVKLLDILGIEIPNRM